MSIEIRDTALNELELVQHIHQHAFGPDEGPVIAELLARLWQDATAKPMVSLLAIDNEDPVGHVLFTTVQISQQPDQVKAMILSPLAVLPARQRSGIGTQLIESGLDRLQTSGADCVFVYGDPAYYSRTGFVPALPFGLHPPHAIEFPEGWQVQTFGDDVLERIAGTVQCCQTLNSADNW